MVPIGLTPLHQAALSNSVRCLSVLLAYGADPSRGDNDEDRPLHTAGTQFLKSCFLVTCCVALCCVVCVVCVCVRACVRAR